MKKVLSLILTGVIAFGFVGCKTTENATNKIEKTSENVGEQAKKQTENVGEQVKKGTENVGENVKKGTENATDQVKKQTENVGENVEKTTENIGKALGIDSLIEEFKKVGFNLGNKETITPSKLGEKKAYRMKVDNQVVEAYEYDMKNLSTEGKRVVEEAKSGAVTIDGKRTPVLFKNGVMLVGVDKHEKKDKISEIFNTYTNR
ncbi:hypothetical protein [Hathewaya massiliensis]|uniref:hypothetical protein n=1 Tax=Hathewaya massiliensis TaxID=1964382 RepID=UPI00115C0D14|nr:hypothetical protein [Hathewaya massiliensis]